METTRQYKIAYTETAIQDMEEKADYISCQFRDPALALTWYTRLRDAIQQNLKTMPLKYPLYSLEPWSLRVSAYSLFATMWFCIVWMRHSPVSTSVQSAPRAVTSLPISPDRNTHDCKTSPSGHQP